MTDGIEVLAMTLFDLLVPAAVAVVGVVLLVIGVRELWFALRVYRGEPLSVAETANDPGAGRGRRDRTTGWWGRRVAVLGRGMSDL